MPPPVPGIVEFADDCAVTHCQRPRIVVNAATSILQPTRPRWAQVIITPINEMILAKSQSNGRTRRKLEMRPCSDAAPPRNLACGQRSTSFLPPVEDSSSRLNPHCG